MNSHPESLPLHLLVSPDWNPNQMTAEMLEHLRESFRKFGQIEPLVVRARGDGTFEVLSGSHRLAILEELGFTEADVIVVELPDDAQAKLLAQALNRIHGEDDPQLQAELLRSVMQTITREDVIAVLPETAQRLGTIAAMDPEDLARSLAQFEARKDARLKTILARLKPDKHAEVERVLDPFLVESRNRDPSEGNAYGHAIVLLCEAYERAVGRTS